MRIAHTVQPQGALPFAIPHHESGPKTIFKQVEGLLSTVGLTHWHATLRSSYRDVLIIQGLIRTPKIRFVNMRY